MRALCGTNIHKVVPVTPANPQRCATESHTMAPATPALTPNQQIREQLRSTATMRDVQIAGRVLVPKDKA
eukprot:139735-Prorocentrum_lima.AAC.1